MILHGTIQEQENKNDSSNQETKMGGKELQRHSKVTQINLDSFDGARMKIALPRTLFRRTLHCVRPRCLIDRR